MIKCPSCGYENVDGTQFCEGCGEELTTAGAASMSSPASASSVDNADTAPANMIKCPACDNLNPADNVVCEVCGTELHPGALGGSATTPFDTPVAPSAPAIDAAPTNDAAPTTDNAAPMQGSPDAAAVATGTQATSSDVVASSATPQPDSTTSSGMPLPDSSVTDNVNAADALADTFNLPNMAADPTAVVVDDAAPASNLEPGKVKLVVEQGMTVGKQFVLGDREVQVGREDDEEGIYPDIDLSDQDEGYVHRRHATLNFNDGKLSVTHLGGANKSRINNRPLPDNEAQPLNIGDKVAFGKVVMRVQNV